MSISLGCGAIRTPRIQQVPKVGQGENTVAYCPMLWFRKIQTETSLSKMEACYVVLSMSIKELLPIIYLVKCVADSVVLDVEETPNMHIFVHEDNVGCLVLENMEPPQINPRYKH